MMYLGMDPRRKTVKNGVQEPSEFAHLYPIGGREG